MGQLDPKHFAALRDMAAEEPLEVETVGGCMEPLIENGARIRVEPRRLYWPGDVVVVRAVDGLRAHRLIGWVPSRSGWKLVAQADATARQAGGGHDDPVGSAAVLGRVVGGDCAREVGRVPFGRRVQALGRFVRQIGRSLRRRANVGG